MNYPRYRAKTAAAAVTAALALTATPAPAQEPLTDLSAEAALSLSSFGSSAAGAILGVGSSLGDSSSARPGAATGARPGQLGDTARVGTTGAQRITYTSANEAGEIVSVTGAFYDTPGAKGLIALAPGTRGMGDHCASSAPYGMLAEVTGSSVNVNYESPVVRMLTGAGYRVVVTDYIGLGSEGVHTYLNRVDQGRALIDAARATAHDNEKIGFWGYSQGGGAAAAAAELVAEYAPELNVVGTFSGAPPADPLAVLETGTEGLVDVVTGFAAISYAATYPEFREALEENLTAEGIEALTRLSEACAIDGARVLGKPLRSYTVDGRTFAQLARDDERIASALRHNTLGRVPVSAPIMVLTNPDDDLVPEPQATQLAADYCALGAPVEYRRVVVPGTPSMPLFTAASGSSSYPVPRIPVAGHASPLLLDTGHAIQWMDQRFAGASFTSRCPGEHTETVLPTGLNAVEIAAAVIGVIAGVAGLLGLGWLACNAVQLGHLPEVPQLLPPEIARLLP